MTAVHFVVDHADEGRVALAYAAAAAWRGSTPIGVHTRSMARVTDADIRVVFADDVVRHLAEIPADRRAEAAERTLVLNAERDGVLELLEAHGLGGAIECERPEGWRESGRLFVRKHALGRATSGEAIPGAGRESPSYVLWRHPRCDTLADLLREYAGACASWAQRNERVTIRAKEAQQQRLPAVGMDVISGGFCWMPRLFPEAGCYVRFETPPGTQVQFVVVDAPGDHPLVEAIRDPRHAPRAPIVVGDPERIELAGARRDALAAFVGAGRWRRTVCLVRVPHATGVLHVVFGAYDREAWWPSCAETLAEGPLKVLAGSFRILGG